MGHDTIQLAHGGGGRLSRELIRELVLPRFGDSPLRNLPDAATLPASEGKLVFTTDSFVVQPLEFPGGDIGRLAVFGTVNDIAVCGGDPKWLSLAFVIEEGLELTVLRRVLDSVKAAAEVCGVTVVTGDTKVVSRGQCDGLYVNTAGIGTLLPGFDLGTERIEAGDVVLASGTLGAHGMAVMASRENIRIEDGPFSDAGTVHRLVAALQPYAPDIHFMRDPTRGGAAAVLNEAVEDRATGIQIEEQQIPLSPGVRAVSEILGLDPLHSASEGRIILFCAPDAATRVLDTWHSLSEGRAAARVGTVTAETRGRVVMQTVAGGRRLIDVPRGELLPRIC